MGEHRALAGIEGRVILQHGDRRGDRGQCRAPGRQLGVPLQQRGAQRFACGLLFGRRQILALDTGAAMDDQQRRSGRCSLGKQGQGQQRGQRQTQFHRVRLQQDE
ncbi:hypothetical protein G6F62_015370 [Rhizopus arrhizus]|nr:hypothetical protein G6F62_015370 [Rhizopus arrhizus]